MAIPAIIGGAAKIAGRLSAARFARTVGRENPLKSMRMGASTNAKEWARAMRLWQEARGATHAEVVNHFAVQTTYKAMSGTPKAQKAGILSTAAKPKKSASTKKQKRRKVYKITAQDQAEARVTAGGLRGVLRNRGLSERARAMAFRKHLDRQKVKGVSRQTQEHLFFKFRDYKPKNILLNTEENQRKFFHAMATGIRREGRGWVRTRGVYRGEGNYKESMRIYGQKRRSIGFIRAGFLKPLADLGEPMRRKPLKGGAAAKSKGVEATKGKKVAIVHNNATGSGDIAADAMDKAKAKVIRSEGNYAIRQLQKKDKKFWARKFS